MRVVVINASPKGKQSITFQSVEYLKKHNQQDKFEIIHVGNKVKKYSDNITMDDCIDRIGNSDLIIFAYPVYTFLVPYQLARFINLLKKRPGVEKLKNKFSTQISTSKHFFDTTAHRYIIENCDDIGLKSITGLAADMDDLLTAQGRTQLKDFYKSAKFAINNDIYNRVGRARHSMFEFVYEEKTKEVNKTDQYDTVIVTDCGQENKSLRCMIDGFISAYKYKVREVNIAEFKFAGGCLGCFDCVTNGSCVYKDGFEDMLRNEIQNADATLLAATIIDHSMGPVFKCFDDRQFCNGHRILTKGKTVGYILDGNLSLERNLQDVIESRSEVGHMYLTGIATNESKDNKKTTKSIEDLAKVTSFCLENKLERPQNFYGVGGMKIFRDLIYTMRGLMKEDHAFYKRHNIYDFPHKQKKLIIRMKLVGMLMSIPIIRKKARGMIKDIILKPYTKAIEKD